MCKENLNLFLEKLLNLRDWSIIEKLIQFWHYFHKFIRNIVREHNNSTYKFLLRGYGTEWINYLNIAKIIEQDPVFTNDVIGSEIRIQ